SRGEPDGVRDRPSGGVAVRDHGQSAETEQIRTAVGVRVEPLAEPARPRADEQSADLAAKRGGDLFTEGLEQALDRALEQLQRDVSGEAVGDNHVAGAHEQVATLRVASEVQVARLEKLMCLERELISLLILLVLTHQW